ncbi:MAG: fimbrillin family protein [Bacteroidales bacterium]|nr:fimbrillin family protein [Bacteroidales bacterium]
MKRIYIYTVLTLAFAVLAGCQRDNPVAYFAEDMILLQPTGSDVATKGFLNAADLPVDGATVKIFDDVTGFDGTITVGEQTLVPQNGVVTYIDDNVVFDGTAWNFQKSPWRWTRTGVHHFYGWLTEDHSVNPALTPTSLVSGVGFNTTSKVLTVPAIAFDKNTTQFDFSYSDKVAVDVTASSFNPNSSVSLPLKHLFSALAVTIQNNGDSDATIVSVSMENLKNKKSATINYSGTQAAVAMTASPAAEQTEFLASGFTNKDFDHGGTKYDLVTGQQIASSAMGSYYMMWPQTAAEVGVKDGEGAIKFVVKYTYDGIYDDPVGDNPAQLHEYTATCYLAEAVSALEAGHKYAINLQFKGKSLELKVEILPWTAKYYDLDYSTSSIQADPAASTGNEGVLWLYTWEYDEENAAWLWVYGPRDRKITMDSGKNIKGDFTILSPRSGQWQITTYPAEAAQYFTISPSSGVIDDLVDPQGNFNGYVEFLISPNGNVPSIQKLYFNVDIEINGVWRNANSEFNRKNWELTRLP